MAESDAPTVTDLLKDSAEGDPISALAETVAELPVPEDTLGVTMRLACSCWYLTISSCSCLSRWTPRRRWCDW